MTRDSWPLAPGPWRSRSHQRRQSRRGGQPRWNRIFRGWLLRV